jgi:hypothetical protein
MTGRRPSPGPDPSLAARGIVLWAMVRVAGELVGQGVRLIGFTLTRARWRREVAARVQKDPLSSAGDTP